MTVRELIEKLKVMDQEMHVCWGSETGNWDLEDRHLEPCKNVRANDTPDDLGVIYSKAIVIGG